MIRHFCIDAHCFSMADLVCSVEEILRKCNCPDAVVPEIHLILEELVTNVVHHGDALEIDLCLQISDDRLVMELSDSGTPFDPLQYEVQGLDEEFVDREIGGMGIYLVKEMADELSYRYENGRNILRCMKKFSREN